MTLIAPFMLLLLVAVDITHLIQANHIIISISRVVETLFLGVILTPPRSDGHHRHDIGNIGFDARRCHLYYRGGWARRCFPTLKANTDNTVK
ncbi:hypothetical protein O9929_08355 [Vibrio lentus]|nr:hypothetical protein [Vibrio lentus]